MYIPPAFKIDCADKISEFIQHHSFATLVTCDQNSPPVATHLPVLAKTGPHEEIVLLAHMARANSQWKSFSDDREVLVIFQGPHAYISPSWYESTVAVPTWNYAAVHVYGRPRLILEDAEFDELLAQTVSKFEQPMDVPWTDQNSPDLREQLKKAIVGFEIEATRIEAKFKLGQNRSIEDAQGACSALRKSSNQTDRDLAELMSQEVLR